MNTYSLSSVQKDYNLACHLYGDDLCNQVKILIESNQEADAKQELNNGLKDYPDNTKINAVKLIMFWSLEKAKRWFN